jgi:hypothetical protein
MHSLAESRWVPHTAHIDGQDLASIVTMANHGAVSIREDTLIDFIKVSHKNIGPHHRVKERNV